MSRRVLLRGAAGAALLAGLGGAPAAARPRASALGSGASGSASAVPVTRSGLLRLTAAATTGATTLLDDHRVALARHLRLTSPVSAVALILPDGVDQAWIRGSGPGGDLGWRRLDRVTDGPDGHVAAASELSWLRAVDELEIAVPEGTAVGDVAVHLFDTLGLTDAAAGDGVEGLLAELLAPVDELSASLDDLLGGLGDTLGGLLGDEDGPVVPVPGSTISRTRPDVVSRSAWGANAPRSRHATARPRAVVLHHTVNRNDYTKREAPAIVRAIQAHHQRTMGWSDVGYNLLIDRYGGVYEGRAGGLEAGVVGAHAAGVNTGTVGVSIIGNHQTGGPTRSGLDRAANVLAWQARVHGIDLRDGARTTVSGRTIPTFLGHRDVGSTACPGQRLYDRLGEVRQLARSAR